jgi:hypothetical protein
MYHDAEAGSMHKKGPFSGKALSFALLLAGLAAVAGAQAPRIDSRTGARDRGGTAWVK